MLSTVLLPFLTLVSSALAGCSFCGTPASGGEDLFFDLSTLPNKSSPAVDKNNIPYYINMPCAYVDPGLCEDGGQGNIGAAVQALGGSNCISLGVISDATTVSVSESGLNVTMNSGPNEPTKCGDKDSRNVTYQFICDKTVSPSNPPDNVVSESPACNYHVTWRTPLACPTTGGTCNKPIPPPAPPAPPCALCLPKWEPTYNMWNSTMLYFCNDSGFHDLDDAKNYGVVVYDWSNAKDIWVNQHPMNDEELLTKQAEMLFEVSPSIPGQQPRVWTYRNTIKALNWYGSVRVKLDDPAYSAWFIKFKDCPAANSTYHVPMCTYGKCSCFYHDQEQTPEYPKGDGSCKEECDCGKNPCGEYIFDHRNASFQDWFINDYMITNETLFHDPPIGLGWMDDSMRITGPTEEDKHFINDTGSSPQVMQELVDAYQDSMKKFHQKLVGMGGWTWQLTHGKGPEIRNTSTDVCVKGLRSWCQPNPPQFAQTHRYQIAKGEMSNSTVEDITAEFLLTRGPYAWLAYGWMGCSSTRQPFSEKYWHYDYGQPKGVCQETGTDTKVFRRDWDKATIEWDCNTGKGSISQQDST
eukprot:m.8584 g.8584  ORF g.8584 m.8584 type:complete len:581 (+) comp7015_c0_seq1:40-1782(+)